MRRRPPTPGTPPRQGRTFLGHPKKLVDFGYRAVHEMTVAAKAIVAAFYGTGPEIFLLEWMLPGWPTGSDGGAALPGGLRWDHRGRASQPDRRDSPCGMSTLDRRRSRNPACTIPASKFAMIHRAVLDACDALDGLKDGLIGDPKPLQLRLQVALLQWRGLLFLPDRCTGGHGTGR